MSPISSSLRPFPVAFLLAVVASALCSPASAQEAWCAANPSNCVMSETFQSTSYTRTLFDGSAAQFTGDQTGSKPGLLNSPFNGTAAIGASFTGSNTFAGNYDIRTDSAILALLPRRNPTTAARFLAAKNNFTGAHRFGYSPISLGSTVKRFALRWYSYHSTTYDWNQDNGGACTNGKLAHISQAAWGTAPFLTLSYQNSSTPHVYSFMNSNGWVWTGRSTFDGFSSAPRPGAAVAPSTHRGKWFRHEIVVRRPRNADSQALGLGFDYSYFVKNVTDNTAEVEDQRLSSGCTNCMPSGGPNFVWNTGTYPTQDINSIHTELYRAGTCRGWQGWIYAVVAKWDTDASQRIGAAIEVEGGYLAPGNLKVQ